MQLIEAIPNFSVGDSGIAEAIGSKMVAESEARLLSCETGGAAGRTVYTLAGEPQAVLAALYRGFIAAREFIDMREHHGVHPRLGAVDVCPLVPITGTTMVETVAFAESLARRLGEELEIPIYLYEESARRPQCHSLEEIRRGQYEGLAKKLADPLWRPDYGPTIFQPRWGATVLGARQPLIAYNVNLTTKEVAVAKKIAALVRSSGSKKSGPGLLKGVKAIGWYIEEYGCAQVSMNITDYRQTSLAQAFYAVRIFAGQLGVGVNGSEVIGLLPRAAFREGWIEELGLDSVSSFDPSKKIIENTLEVGYNHRRLA